MEEAISDIRQLPNISFKTGIRYESTTNYCIIHGVRSSRLAKAGDLSSAVGFNIKLNDCDTNVSSNAAVAFLGTTVTSNDDTLALQSSAAGSAQNVGIQILDRTGEVLVLDGATFSAKTDLIDGTNILPFQARYIALGQSVAGTANADATFKVQYL